MNRLHYIHETHVMADAYLPYIYHPSIIRGGSDTANWHENIEVLAFFRGSGRICLGAEWHDVSAGDIAIIDANLLHHTVSDEVVEYHCLIVDRAFCEENGIDILSLKFVPIIKSGLLFDRFSALVDNIEQVKLKNDNFAVPKVRLALLDFLITLCSDYLTEGELAKPIPAATERVKSVMLYLQSRISDTVTLDEISEHIGISKYHLSREFKLYAGTTIFDYLNTIRCKEAERLLSMGATVSEAAVSCGFDSLSYFSRSFKKYTGRLPSSYTKSKRKEK